MNKYVMHYATAVQHPDVSGFEMLEMLQIRDKLVDLSLALDVEEKGLVADADQHLIRQASGFHAELNRITNMKYEREQRKPSPDHWWWYLDVIVSLPSTLSSTRSTHRVPA